jgi:cytochrome c-type biogenesis protein
VLVALGLQTSKRMLGFLGRHRLAMVRLGGGLLIVIGLALVSGLWTAATGAMQGWVSSWQPVV